MSRLRSILGVLLAVGAMACAAVASAQPSPIKTFRAEPASWPAGTWDGWKKAFLMPEGRVVDNGNANISHSEGQGYGMLLAVLADDRAAFDRIFAWTKKELMIRPDGLASWKWEPEARPNITDPNLASDGDLLIAWALAEAAERWSERSYAAEAARIAVALDKAVGLRSPFGRIMLPAPVGFGVADNPDGPIVNPSYWIFPAFDRLRTVAPGVDWAGYAASGHTLLRNARFGPAGLPTDWVALAGGRPAPAEKFPKEFGYNAVRIPLYLAWAAQVSRENLQPFVSYYEKNNLRAYVHDVAAAANTQEFGDPGYDSLFALAKCALDETPIPFGLRSVSFNRYYSATLHMLALATARLRYQKCL